jgi:hypothetical protein
MNYRSRDYEYFLQCSQQANVLQRSNEEIDPTYEYSSEDEKESSPQRKKQRKEIWDRASSSSSDKPKVERLSAIETVLERYGELVPVYFTRQEYDHLKMCSTSLHVCMTAMVASLVRSAAQACSDFELCGLMPMAIPRHLSAVQKLNAPHLCFACALFPKERCVKHAELQTRRMVQVVQNQFIPPSDNVDALYLELQRCLIYSGIVSNLEEKVGRIRDAIYEHGPYAEGDVEHRVQCATQGLAWCILETNMLDSVTRIQYGGLSTFGSMQEVQFMVCLWNLVWRSRELARCLWICSGKTTHWGCFLHWSTLFVTQDLHRNLSLSECKATPTLCGLSQESQRYYLHYERNLPLRSYTVSTIGTLDILILWCKRMWVNA